MNKTFAIFLVIIGFSLFLYYLKMELNRDLSKEWISSLFGIIVAVILFLWVLYEQKKKKSNN